MSKEITMETDCFNINTMSHGGKDGQKQEDTQTAPKGRKLYPDQLKEDGIRKELYKNERKAQEDWNKRWGFLQNSEKLQREEIEKQGFPQQFDWKSKQQMTPAIPEGAKPAFELFPAENVPVKSSEIIGWRLFTPKNNLNRLAGPMYVSPKLTMNLPSSPDEPDLSQQRIIYLG